MGRSSLLTLLGGVQNSVPAPPTPLTILSGVRAWYQFSDTATVAFDPYNTITTVADKSGFGNNIPSNPLAGQRPLYNTQTLNGKNVIAFNGSGNVVPLPSSLFTIPNGPAAVFVTFKSASTVAMQRIFAGILLGSTKFGIQYLRTTPNNIGASQNPSFNPVIHTITPDTSQHLCYLNRSGANLTIGFDGVSTTAAVAADATIDTLFLGAGAGVGDPFNGVIGEVVFCNQSQSPEQLAAYRAYTQSEWATP